MQAGSLITSDVMAYTSRVMVGGLQRPVESWSISRELSGDLPAQIVAGSGITQATGSISWASASDADAAATNPWNLSTGWIPAKGDKVEIFAGDGTTEWKQFTGLIDRTSGSIGDAMQSTIIDPYDKLSARVSHDALLRIMPPLVAGEAHRAAGLVSTYYVDLAMRTAGFYTTPNRAPGTCLFVPFQGGAWPHVGSLSTALSFDYVDRTPSNKPAPWGFGIGNARLTYLPHWVESASVPVQITLMVAPSHAEECNIDITYSTGRWVRLSVSADRSITARSGDASTFTDACTLTAAQMNGATVVTMLVKGGVYSLRNDKGEAASGAAPAPSGATETITVNAFPGAAVGGLMVNYANAEYLEHSPSRLFVPSARIDTGNVSHLGTMGASRAIDNVSAEELITEISEATLSAMWIDELGVLQWVPSMVLRNQPANHAITTLSDIFSLDWEDSLLASRSKVTVKYKAPSITTSSQQNVELYVGNGASLGSGESIEEIAEPGADEAWIMPHDHFTRVGTYNWPPYNRRRGTFVGIYYSSDGQAASEAGLNTDITMEKLGIQTYKFTHTAGTYPAGVEANLATSPTHADLWDNRHDQPLPRMGGFGKVKWTDAEVSPEGPGGSGPELIIDGGIWLAPTIAANVATFTQSQTVTPLPTITGLEVLPDPRRQLGDAIVIESENLMGVFIKALVVGVENSGSSNGYAQSLTVRVIGVTGKFVTYAAFDEALPGSSLTYQQWQALGPIPETYSQFNSIS